MKSFGFQLGSQPVLVSFLWSSQGEWETLTLFYSFIFFKHLDMFSLFFKSLQKKPEILKREKKIYKEKLTAIVVLLPAHSPSSPCPSPLILLPLCVALGSESRAFHS